MVQIIAMFLELKVKLIANFENLSQFAMKFINNKIYNQITQKINAQKLKNKLILSQTRFHIIINQLNVKIIKISKMIKLCL